MKTSLFTKVHYTEGERDKENNLKTYITTEKAFNTALEAATKSGEAQPQLIAKQSFVYHIPETIGEALTASGVTNTAVTNMIDELLKEHNIDVTLFLDTFNNTAGILKQHNEAADLIKAESFTPTDEAKNLAYTLAQKTERAKMTPEEKSAKMLGITTEQLRAALALVQQQAQATTA